MGTVTDHPLFLKSLTFVCVVMALLLVPAVAADAQTQTGLYIGGLVSTALIPDDVVTNGAVGLQIGFRAPTGLLLVGDFHYAGEDYYYFDFDRRGWVQAASWQEVPNGSVSRGAWPFYRTRSFFGGAIGYSASGYSFGYFGTVGFMFGVLQASGAAEDYPDFEKAVLASSLGSSPVSLSTSLRIGATFPSHGPFTGQLAYMLLLDSQRDAVSGEATWFRRNSMLMLGLVVNTGIY